jgi:crotonobetainyl-CoA:carnitine CoA-transferase CaiB-like acyl-CoA transferase
VIDERPFSGLLVVDASAVLAGPYAGYQFGLLGARVIKVEDPGNPDFVREVGTAPDLNERLLGTQFLTQNASKEFLTLNLKDERGHTAFMQLLARADVLIVNARPGAFSKTGLGFAELSAHFPRLIYCAISAFGNRGDKSWYRGYENVIQAASGYMSANGTPEVRPLRQGSPAIDYGTGIAAAFAIASALYKRTETGKGTFLDVAMIDVAAALMGCHITSNQHSGFEPIPTGNQMALATCSAYQTADGLLMVSATNARQMHKLWALLGHEELTKPDSFNTPSNDYDTEHAVLSEILLSRSAQEWEKFLQENGIPAARVRETLTDALGDEQYSQRHAFSPVAVPDIAESVTVPWLPFRYGDTYPMPTLPPRAPGYHSASILSELGYSTNDIQTLEAEGVTSWPSSHSQLGAIGTGSSVPRHSQTGKHHG